MARIEKEVREIESLEEDIEHGIKAIESQNSLGMVLFYGILLGIFSNIGATIIYELLMSELNASSKIMIAIAVLIALPVIILLIIMEFRKMKNTKSKLNVHLDNIRRRKSG
jgi:hypothetical protein